MGGKLLYANFLSLHLSAFEPRECDGMPLDVCAIVFSFSFDWRHRPLGYKDVLDRYFPVVTALSPSDAIGQCNMFTSRCPSELC